MFLSACASAPFPSADDVETYRDTVESVFMADRGGTMSGGERSYASCVMCHTWQTDVRFSLERPEINSGWTSEQSRRNFDVVSQLINTDDPENSRLLLKPLDSEAGGLTHTGGTYWTSRDDPSTAPSLNGSKACRTNTSRSQNPRSTSSSSARASSPFFRLGVKARSVVAAAIRVALTVSRRSLSAITSGATRKPSAHTD